MPEKDKTNARPRGRMPRKTVSLPPEIEEQLEKMAAQRKVSFSWLVRDAVEKYLAADAPLFQRTF